MERENSFNLDDSYRIPTSKSALSQLEALLKEQNLIGYIEGYLHARGFSGSIKDVEDKNFYDKLHHVHEEEKNKNLSLLDLKVVARERIDSYVSEKIQKDNP